MSNHPEYPQPFRNLFGNDLPCPRCNRMFEFRDFSGLGVAYPAPENDQVVDQEPIAKVYAFCPQCQALTAFETESEKSQLLFAIEWFYDLIGNERAVEDQQVDDSPTLPSPNYPTRQPDLPRISDASAHPRSEAEEIFKYRQHYYRRMLSRMPGDREYKAFRNKLKSYNQKLWMRPVESRCGAVV